MKRKRTENIYWGIVLILVGALFLADNLGFVDFEFGPHIFKTYWPVILILIGISSVIKSLSKKEVKDADRAD